MSFKVDLGSSLSVSRHPPSQFDAFIRQLPLFPDASGADADDASIDARAERENGEFAAAPEDSRLCMDARGRLWCLREDSLFYTCVGGQEKDTRVRRVRLYDAEEAAESSPLTFAAPDDDERGAGGEFKPPSDCFAISVNAECNAVLLTAPERCFVVQVPSDAFEESVFAAKHTHSDAKDPEDEAGSVLVLDAPVAEVGSVFRRTKIAIARASAADQGLEQMDLSVIQAAFHPGCNNNPYIGVLYSDFRFSLYRVHLGTVSTGPLNAQDWEGEDELHFSLDNEAVHPDGEVSVSSFCFGSVFQQTPSASVAFLWNAFTVHFLLENGGLCALCPVAMQGAQYKTLQVVELHNHCLRTQQHGRAQWLQETFALNSVNLDQDLLTVVVSNATPSSSFSSSSASSSVVLQGPCAVQFGVGVPVNEYTSFCSSITLLPCPAPPPRLLVLCEPDPASNREQAMACLVVQTRPISPQWRHTVTTHHAEQFRSAFSSAEVHPLSPPSLYMQLDEDTKAVHSLCRAVLDPATPATVLVNTPWATYALDLGVLSAIQRQYDALNDEDGAEQQSVSGDLGRISRPREFRTSREGVSADLFDSATRGCVVVNGARHGRYILTLDSGYTLSGVRVPIYQPPSLRITGSASAAELGDQQQPAAIWPNKALFAQVDALMADVKKKDWGNASREWDTTMETDYAALMEMLQDMTAVRTGLFTASRCLREAETGLKIEFKRQDRQTAELVTTIDELRDMNEVLTAQIEANTAYNEGLKNHIDSFAAVLDESEPPSRQEQEFSKRIALYASKKVPLLEKALEKLSTHSVIANRLRKQDQRARARQQGSVQPSEEQLALVYPVLQEQMVRMGKLRDRVNGLLERC